MGVCILPRSGKRDTERESVQIDKSKCLWPVAALALCLSFPASARPVRVATFNLLFGVGSVNSPEYNAVADTLTRIDADVVAFQELT